MAHLHAGLPQRPDGALPAGSLHNVNPNDPNALIQFAVGPINCAQNLRQQRRGQPMEFQKMYFDQKRTFVVKKAMIGQKDDWRCFDAHTGKCLYNSHHPGHNPYAALDPLGIGGPGGAPAHGGPMGMGGEWEALCDVSGHGGGFKIRPKQLSMHGRQVIKTMQGKTVMSVAKQSRVKTMSLSASFIVTQEIDSGLVMGMGAGSSGEQIMIISSDLGSRTLQFHNMSGELIAIAQKPAKTLILNAAFGVGSEMQLEVAAGVDCSVMLAAFLGLQQCGEHVLKDALGNFVIDPMKDEAVGTVVDVVPGADIAQDAYGQAQGQAMQGVNFANKLNKLMAM